MASAASNFETEARTSFSCCFVSAGMGLPSVLFFHLDEQMLGDLLPVDASESDTDQRRIDVRAVAIQGALILGAFFQKIRKPPSVAI